MITFRARAPSPAPACPHHTSTSSSPTHFTFPANTIHCSFCHTSVNASPASYRARLSNSKLVVRRNRSLKEIQKDLEKLDFERKRLESEKENWELRTRMSGWTKIGGKSVIGNMWKAGMEKGWRMRMRGEDEWWKEVDNGV